MAFDSIIFDLDGTLWDTSASCAIAWNQVLTREGIPYREITADDVRIVTGKPHPTCIEETFVDLPQTDIQKLIRGTESEDNVVIARLGGTLYPGVRYGLPRLSERYRLFIASNCQSGYIETFLRFSGLAACFQDFECYGNTGQHKGLNVESLIHRNGLKSPLMVGDASGDEAAARHCNIPYAFVTYGFGDPYDPDYTFDGFNELADWLFNCEGNSLSSC